MSQFLQVRSPEGLAGSLFSVSQAEISVGRIVLLFWRLEGKINFLLLQVVGTYFFAGCQPKAILSFQRLPMLPTPSAAPWLSASFSNCKTLVHFPSVFSASLFHF